MSELNTAEKEAKIVAAIREFNKVAAELELDALTLCRIRDKFFPVVNTGRVCDPSGLAHAVRLMDAHSAMLKKLLFELFGIKFEEFPLIPAVLANDYPSVPVEVKSTVSEPSVPNTEKAPSRKVKAAEVTASNDKPLINTTKNNETPEEFNRKAIAGRMLTAILRNRSKKMSGRAKGNMKIALGDILHGKPVSVNVDSVRKSFLLYVDEGMYSKEDITVVLPV